MPSDPGETTMVVALSTQTGVSRFGDTRRVLESVNGQRAATNARGSECGTWNHGRSPRGFTKGQDDRERSHVGLSRVSRILVIAWFGLTTMAHGRSGAIAPICPSPGREEERS
jgi:hypothetical protein